MKAMERWAVHGRRGAVAALAAGAIALFGTSSSGCGDSFETCAAGTQCVCEGDCQFECDGPGCEFECKRSDITCEFRCPEGGCKASCESANSCSMACAGDNCDVDCSGTDCRITECSSNCQLDCDGADVCENSCTEASQGCQTDRD